MQALFLVTFIIEMLFALGFLIAPGTLLGTFGVELDVYGITLARMFGTALLAFCTLAWYARSKDSAVLKLAAVRSLFTYWLASTVLLVIAQLSGLFNAMGWSTIVLHLGFALWSAPYAFKNQ